MYSVKKQSQKTRKCSTVLHETNYAKLLYVIPSVKTLGSRLQMATRHSSQFIELDVLEKSKFTTTLQLDIRHSLNMPWLKHLNLSIRLYHDARVAEVLSFQNHRRFEPKYDYPNPRMYHKNEKQQLNQFLSEWLDYCIKHRYIFKENLESLDM